MKLIFSIALFFFLLFPASYAQNWDPFPLGQKTYFKDWNKVELYIMDSVKYSGDTAYYLFRQKEGLPGAHRCGRKITDTVFLFTTFIPPCSFSKYRDKIYSDGQLFFLPNASLNDSWEFSLPNKTIIFSCDTIKVEQFLGITDSVKTFSLQIKTSSQAVNFKFKLSKNYGFIEFIPPGIMEIYNVENWKGFELFGISKDNEFQGYKQPTIDDFLPYSLGDILYWNEYIDIFDPRQKDSNVHYLDSITDVTTKGGNFIITYDRTTIYKNQNTKYSKGGKRIFQLNELKNILETLPKWAAIGDPIPEIPGVNDNNAFWFSGDLFVGVNNAKTDTFTEFSFIHEGKYLDTNYCIIHEIPDISAGFTFSTQRGLTGIWHISNSGSTDLSLIGAMIGGKTYGKINYTGLKEESAIQPEIKIYPNPATDYLYLEEGYFNTSYYRIYNIHGQKVTQGHGGKTIPVANLQPGIFVLQIVKGDRSYFARFVKVK